ncbi:MAG: Holliday junction branch migration DNA helicase RuvB [Deltaproteobacteria bacterium]|nr:Holliday junction branch migration DNA helicase RuvB [Deltaproteobacteria bacterium]MCX7952506.1 Holliday junction branch migration DNA helicase RuvB [Deltaproteobacteria bacterium]
MSLDKSFDSETEEVINILRPTNFDEFIGQENVKLNLKTAVSASKIRSQPVDHVLLYGPPGLGKTSLAKIVARELGVKLTSTTGPALEKPFDLAAILNSLEQNEILFIDEIHRTPKPVEEILYSAMEDFRLHIVTGQGLFAKTIELNLKPFTLIGATTRTGLLSSPLRDRFGIILRLDYYSDADLCQIILQSAKKLEIEIEDSAAHILASRSRGTPRIANRLLKRASDLALVTGVSLITEKIANDVCSMLQIDENGLDWLDRKVLETLFYNFRGGPAGLSSISASTGEPEDSLEDVVEPFLLQKGLIIRTKKGRCLTEKGKNLVTRSKTLFS